MKKLFSSIFFLTFLIINTSSAQEIPFDIFKGDLNKAISQANNNHKNVLVYFTAKWCGPCITMQKEVFPKAEVKDFISKNYIFIKADIDSAEDKTLVDKLSSGSVPEFCILDSVGNKQFSFLGYHSKADLLRLLNDGLAPEKTVWMQFRQKFQNGQRSVDFLKAYLDTLEVYKDPMADSVYTILLSVVDNNEMQSKYMIGKMAKYLREKRSRDYQFILNNKNTLSKIYNPELIDEFLLRPWSIELEEAAIKGDKESYEKIAKEISSLNINETQTESMLYYGEKTLLLKSKDYKNYILLIESDKYPSVFNSNRFDRIEDGAITIAFSDINDKKLLIQAKDWMEESLVQQISSRKLSIAGQIQEKLGNKKEALIIYNKSIQQYLIENPESDIPPGLQSLVENLEGKIDK